MVLFIHDSDFCGTKSYRWMEFGICRSLLYLRIDISVIERRTVDHHTLLCAAVTMAPANSNESYCTFTLPSDVTAGGLPSQEEIAKDLESSDAAVC